MFGWLYRLMSVPAAASKFRRAEADEVLRVRRQLALLDEAFNRISHGMCVFTAERRLALCNARFAAMFALPGGLTRAGVPLRAIADHLIAAGMLAPGKRNRQVARWLSIVRAMRPSRALFELDDGRVLSVALEPLSGGDYVSTVDDITEQHVRERRIAYLAHHDALTGLPNRAAFDLRLAQTFANCATSDESFAVLCIDLDHFKLANDRFGHAAGDRLLREFATRLQGAAGRDFIARVGGDEFTMICRAGTAAYEAVEIAQRLLDVTAADFDIDGHRLNIGLSIGIAVYPYDGADTATLLSKADMALYRAKADGRYALRLFEPQGPWPLKQPAPSAMRQAERRVG